MATTDAPVVARDGSTDRTAPLVVLLHGRGSHEQEILSLTAHLPTGSAYAAVRAPIAEGGGYAWFANRGIGRPISSSLREGLDWFRAWLELEAPAGRPVVLIGFSGGAAFAGGLLLDDPARFAGAAILYGTLPFEAGVPVTAGHLSAVPVFVAQGDQDTVIPKDLQDRTWTYLHHDSEATVTSHRDPGGHTLTLPVIESLSIWLQSLPLQPHPSDGSARPRPRIS
ncbi:hypothetical protein [Actinoplanes sp. NPDC023714]|uniref:alpha/beta hydrolase n=1 Tax=Actinoplanes sp. NPDC023714 TaxID=3154322 RepID=UPI0033CE1607